MARTLAIKDLDPKHMVTIGLEGDTIDPAYNGIDFEKLNSVEAIDYATIHIWVENWNWYDPWRRECQLFEHCSDAWGGAVDVNTVSTTVHVVVGLVFIGQQGTVVLIVGHPVVVPVWVT